MQTNFSYRPFCIPAYNRMGIWSLVLEAIQYPWLTFQCFCSASPREPQTRQEMIVLFIHQLIKVLTLPSPWRWPSLWGRAAATYQCLCAIIGVLVLGYVEGGDLLYVYGGVSWVLGTLSRHATAIWGWPPLHLRIPVENKRKHTDQLATSDN